MAPQLKHTMYATCDQTWLFFFSLNSTQRCLLNTARNDSVTWRQDNNSSKESSEKERKKKRCTICIIRHLIPVHCLLSSSDSLLNLTYASFHYEKTFQPLALDELIVAGHFLSRMLTEDSQLLECIHATYVHVLAMQSCKCQQTHNEM